MRTFTRRHALVSICAGFVFAVSCSSVEAAEPKALAAQTSREGGIAVKVTPLSGFPSDQPWRFEIVQDTHSGALSQDLKTSVVLIDATGEHAPSAAEGDQPGGHHRKNIVSFPPLSPVPAAVTLKVRGVGVPERTFVWKVPD